MNEHVLITQDTTVCITGNEPVFITIPKNHHVNLLMHYKDEVNSDVVIYVEQDAVLNVLFHYDAEVVNEVQKICVQKNSEVKLAYAYLKKMKSNQKFDVLLQGEHAKVEIASGILASYDITMHMNVEHQAKDTYANMEHYVVVSNQAKFTLTAIGKINEKMSGSSAHQTTRVLTMAKNHHCEVTPVLIIDENDVAASHANSIGQPDDLQLYYLQSRGLTIQQALNLISSGYLEPMIQLLEETPLSDTVKQLVEKKVGIA